MIFKALKMLLPGEPRSTRVVFGPLRGARLVLNPRTSVRKILGLYEHELNGWLEATLRQVDRVLDVGANDGYFTFGCAAAFRRLNKRGEIIAFEPQQRNFEVLEQGLGEQTQDGVRITLVQSLVGSEIKENLTTLDAVRWNNGDPTARTNTLVKIDVEGAEDDVLAGGLSWLNSRNRFLIEVHRKEFLDSIPLRFEQEGLILDRVDQRPLFGIGREVRDRENWWLVSRSGLA